jgi:hypothetical protein
MKRQLQLNLSCNLLSFAPGTLFMHESVFEEGHNENALVPPEQNARKLQWWEDEEALAEANVQDPDCKIRRYLKESKEHYDSE